MGLIGGAEAPPVVPPLVLPPVEPPPLLPENPAELLLLAMPPHAVRLAARTTPTAADIRVRARTQVSSMTKR
jgi:hypothetical protein